jgi:hypothetical protein
MDNSSAHSRYSELLLSQHLYHVSPEPTLDHQEQVETSEDEDEEREESSIGNTQHNDAKVYSNTKLLCGIKVT